jgi:hypothetical protein
MRTLKKILISVVILALLWTLTIGYLIGLQQTKTIIQTVTETKELTRTETKTREITKTETKTGEITETKSFTEITSKTTQTEIATETTKTENLPKEIVLQPPFYLIAGPHSPKGFVQEFFEKFREKFSPTTSLLGGYPLVEGVTDYYQSIKESTSIIVLVPDDLNEYQELFGKYPDICPVSPEQIKARFIYSTLIYFADKGKIRGIIIASEVNSKLAESLLKKVVLNVFFTYDENGEIVTLG